jgi:hypothetical protein
MAKKGKLVTSPSKKAYYKAYPARYVKNRKAKLERHILANPNDKQAEEALEKGDFTYRRHNKSATERRRAEPKMSAERKALKDKMLEIHVKHGIPRAPEPAYLPILRELSERMKPKVRYKRGKKIKETT